MQEKDSRGDHRPRPRRPTAPSKSRRPGVTGSVVWLHRDPAEPDVFACTVAFVPYSTHHISLDPDELCSCCVVAGVLYRLRIHVGNDDSFACFTVANWQANSRQTKHASPRVATPRSLRPPPSCHLSPIMLFSTYPREQHMVRFAVCEWLSDDMAFGVNSGFSRLLARK